MNREILFKGKEEQNGNWIQGDLIHRIAGPTIGALDSDGLHEAYVDEETICQYTGLVDKNGKEIWENDIVAYLDTYSTDNGYAEADCIGEVVWDEETISFQVTGRLSAESYEVLGECSVIGNIFDNPELVRGEAK
jgi:uncharacterized phage protein (TIGR01671 family)